MTAVQTQIATHFPVHYKTICIDGQDVFYREAGSAGSPVILLLHGFPTSSNMFRNLIPLLSDSFHLVAPDYPGYGQSSMPDNKTFNYNFDHYAYIIDHLLERLGVSKYIIYVMDYGAPVGYRLALLHPDRVRGLIVQNGNAYEEGLREFWEAIKKYWASPDPNWINGMIGIEQTRWQYENGVVDKTLLDPTVWMLDQALLDRPGNAAIQADLMYDYRTNLALYPKFQAFFREYQPPTLVVWGKNDYVFPPEGAYPYGRDLKDIEVHLLDTGHFALETHGEEIASHIREFFLKRV